MAKLKSIDLRPNTDPSDQPATELAAVEQYAATLPRLETADASRARVHANDVDRLRDEPRVTFAINNLQVSIRSRFIEEAQRRGWTHKQLFVEMIRSFGVDVPPYEVLDGRRR